MSDDPPSPPSSVGVWLTIGAAVAAALAIFTGLGIEEEFLRRMVRNFPLSTATSIGLVIIGGSLAATSALILLVMKNPSRHSKWWASALGIASAAFVTGGMIYTLSTGVASLRSRDMPGLSFSAVKSESGEVSISAEATAKSLRSSEKIMLRLYGVEQDVYSDPDELCMGGSWPDIKDQDGSSVMWWGESGPDQTGAAAVSQSLVVDGERFSLVCAYAAIVNPVQDWWFLSYNPETYEDEPFFAWSLVDLRNLISAPTKTPAP